MITYYGAKISQQQQKQHQQRSTSSMTNSYWIFLFTFFLLATSTLTSARDHYGKLNFYVYIFSPLLYNSNTNDVIRVLSTFG